ncbi:MAG: ABC transporter ATP-binding protein [Spirochaetota bacterium]
MPNPLLEARGISKRYAENGIQATDEADLVARPGEVHAVVGENGAGKSTLMQVIAGVVEQDAGVVRVAGRALPPGDPRAAGAAGIVMSYQHPRLDRALTVLENLFLGEEPRRFGFLFDRRAADRRAHDVAPDFPARLYDRRLDSLSSGQIRMVSLVAALLRLPTDGPGVLILDEPTEAATPAEVEHIFSVIRATAAEGHAVIFISHKLPEVVRIAHAATVLHAGRTVASIRSDISVERLAGAMVGDASRIADPGGPRPGTHQTERPSGDPALLLESVTVRSRERELLVDVSLEVAPGEILGITGIRENGVEALEELLGGTLQPSRGRFEVLGQGASGLSPDRLRRLGLRYVPTDRLFRGASVRSSVSENLIALKRRHLQRAGILDAGEVDEFASALRSSFGIEGSLHVPLWQLSGGNIQKVILSRELEGDPRLIVICEPSWGLDFRSRARIVELIRRRAHDGAAVVVISTDVDEVLDLATRIGVLYDGRLAALYPRHEATREKVGRAMAGAVGPDTTGTRGRHA